MKNKKLDNKIFKEKSFIIPEGYFELLEDAVISKMANKKATNKEGFKTPDNYFNTLEDSVLNKIEKNNNKKETGYEVPSNYFENLEPSILRKIDSNKPEVKVFKLRKLIYKSIIPMAVAASLILIVLLNDKTKPASMDNVAAQEIEQWIDNDLLVFDNYQLAEVYKDNDLLNEPTLLEMDEEILEYIDGTDIESLLIEN